MNTQNKNNQPTIITEQYSGGFYIKSEKVSSLCIVANATTLSEVEDFFARKIHDDTHEDYKIFYDCVRAFCMHARRHNGKLLDIKEYPNGLFISVAFNNLDDLLFFRNIQKAIIESVMMKKA